MKVYFAYTHAENGGFGILGKGIRDALKRMPGVELVSDDNCGFPGLLDKEGYKKIPKVDIIFTYGMPDLFQYAKKLKQTQKYRPIHLHYFVWESSKLPPSFVKTYKTADYLLTATDYTAKNALKQGLKANVWHHGVDNRFQFQERLDDGIFTFLHHNAYEYRKNWDIVLLAFMQEFALDEPVKLVLKGRERKAGMWIMPEMKMLSDQTIHLWRKDKRAYFEKYAKIDHPLIEEKLGHLTDKEMVELNQRADCFVFPAKGEGWGLPPFEAAAMGIIPIVPHFGCFSEWVNKDLMLTLKPDGFLNAEPRYPGYMYYVGINQVRKKMREAFENQDRNRKRARALSGHIHANYNWDKVGKKLYDYLSAFVFNTHGKLK